jgi:hypothetical protein
LLLIHICTDENSQTYEKVQSWMTVKYECPCCCGPADTCEIY